MKKAWRTPELVILFRGRPEEAILCNCKHKTMAPVSPQTFQNGCNIPPYCASCQGNAAVS